MKYKIKLTCWDYGNHEPHVEEVDEIFDNEEDAMDGLLVYANYEVQCLNQPDDDNDEQRYFEIDLEGGDGFDAVIRCWDGDDYMNVTGYNIIKIKE